MTTSVVVRTVPAVPVIVTGVSTATTDVCTRKPTDVAPAGILTDAGTVTDGPPEVRATVIPAVPAFGAPVKTAMHMTDWPPCTALGVRISAASVGFKTVKVAVLFTAFRFAVIVADPSVVCGRVDTAKIALVAPAGTDTDAGTVARAAELDVRVTE